MEAFLQRLLQEQAALDQNVTKLRAFTATDAFSALDSEHQGLLIAQLGAMVSYNAILKLRIAALTRQKEGENGQES